jgi:hypothetical protein
MNGKIWGKDEIQSLIDKSGEATARALLVVYDNQTASEKSQGQTIEHNGVGFSSRDAEFLTDVAIKYKRYGRWASTRQRQAVAKCVRRYWKQVLTHMVETKGAEEVKGRIKQAPAPDPAQPELIEEPTGFGAY